MMSEQTMAGVENPSSMAHDTGTSVLGAGMTHRARSQSVLGQHWSPSGLVGAVGRASVGFGLAVGRSRAIRPTVRFDDLNSAALRPSFDLWRHRRADVGADDAGGDGAASADDAAYRGLPRSQVLEPGASASIRRSVAPGSPHAGADRTSVGRARRHPPQRARPTWTDQIIQRSSIGFVASAPGSTVPESALPADFVPSGNPKLDQLRLLVRERDRGASPAPTLEPEQSAASRVDRGGRAVLRRTTASAPTVSTGTDAPVPGRLARAMRPESAVASVVPQARLGTGAGKGATAPAAAAPGSSGLAPRGRSAPAGRSRPSATPTRIDQLRSMLVEQGILDVEQSTPANVVSADAVAADAATSRGADGDTPVARTERRSRPDDARGDVRSTSPSTSTDLRRAATNDIRRMPAARPASPLGESFSTSPSSGPMPSNARTTSPTSSSSLPSNASSTPSPSGTTDSPGPPPSGAHTSVASPDGSIDQRGTRPSSPTASAFPEATSPTSPTSPTSASPTSMTSSGAVAIAERASETSTSLPFTSRPAQQLRAQRLLRSGLVGETSQFDAPQFDASEPSTIQHTGVDRVAEAVPTSSAIVTIDAPGVPVIARSMGISTSVPTPSLARIDSSASTVIRRVTLPRALSSAHRPAPYFASVGVHHAPGTARTAGPASTITLAQAGETRASVPVLTMTPTGAGRAASRSSLTPTGSSALLDVIRRSAAVDRTAPSGHESVDAFGRSGSTLRSGTDLVRRMDSVSPVNSVSNAPLVDRAVEPTPSVNSVSNAPLVDRTVEPTPSVNRASNAPLVDRAVEPTPSVNRAANAASTNLIKPVAVAGAPVVAARHGAGDDPQPARTELETVRPAERVAQQFMTALSETVRRRPAPLPTTFRPLADAIAGPRPVMLSTDAASRKALRSVGKVAATMGDTIHLDHSAVSAARLDEVMAHELTHVAHPSPTPRFFDDIDDSPEERRAEQVARVMARSPLAPSATTSAPSVRDGQHQRTIRRSAVSSPTSPASRAPSQGTVSAQSLAAGLTATGASSNVVQRWDSATPSTESKSSRGAQLGSHRADPAPAATVAPSAESKSDDMSSSDPSVEWFREQLDNNLDRVVRLLEDRMIVELERRGGRAWRQS